MDLALATRLAGDRARFLSFVQRQLGGRTGAEDLLQAALLKAAEQGHGLREGEHAEAWFFRLLRNLVVDARRRAAREQRALDEGKLADGAPAEAGAGERICRCAASLVPTLPPSQARLLRRVDLEGASLAEVAAEERITANNAGVRLHRARAALREKLKLVCGACARRGCLDCGCPPRTVV